MRKTIAALMAAFTFWGVAASAEEVKQTYNGLTLNANLELAEGKTVADGAVLMTHGTLGHNGMEIIKTLQGLLKERGQNTLAITLSLGKDDRHGMYGCEGTHDHRHADALDEIGAWLEWLKNKGAKDVVLLGHSRGGDQTAWFAVERDDPAIRKIVLIAPMTWSQAGTEENYEARYGKPLNPVLHRARAMIREGRGKEAMEHVGFLYCKDATVTAETFVSYYNPEPRLDTPFLLKKLSKPVIVFTGTEDTAVPDVAEKIIKRGLNGKVKLVEIDGADHYFRDIFAQDVADAIVEFVGE